MDPTSVQPKTEGEQVASDPTSAASVRPPDLVPEEVRPAASDVLDGWDVGVDEAEVASWRADHRPFPTDAVVLAASGLAGSAVGAWLHPRRRWLGAAIGACAGIGLGGLVRRIWRLPV